MNDPIEPKHHATMNRLAQFLDVYFNDKDGPKNIGFALLIFEFGKIDNGRVNYISNGKREDMIVAVKEWLARAEGRVAETETKQ